MKKQRSKVCDERICVRLPKALVTNIRKETDKENISLSLFVRSALVEMLTSRVSG